MKAARLGVVLLATVIAAMTAIGQEKSEMKATVFKGYLADKMCGSKFVQSGDSKTATDKAKKHSKDCALADNCSASGFGLVVGAKYLKFDAAGDKYALDYLNKTKKTNNLWVEVKGTADGDNINVASIEDVKSAPTKKHTSDGK